MAGDTYTILFVSEKEEKTRRVRLSKSGLRFLVLTVFVSVVGGITALIYSADQLKQITDLNADNEKMRSERKEVVEMIPIFLNFPGEVTCTAPGRLERNIR